MKYIKSIETLYPLFLLAAIITGFVFPQYLIAFEGYTIFILMTIIGVLYLKVDVIDMLTHLKRPLFLLYTAFVILILTPLLNYFIIYRFLDPTLATGLVLLSALPAGVSSAAFTDIMKGRTSLSLTIIVLTNLLAAVTIPLIFLTLFKTNLQVDYMGLFLSITKVMLIPFVIAKLLKRLIFREINQTMQEYYNPLIIVLLSLMLMITISFQAEYILTNFSQMLKILGWLYISFFAHQMIGYFSVFWGKKGGKVAVSNSNLIMNNVLGIVLAIGFFPPEILPIMILSFIPWTTMVIAKHWYLKYLP